MEEKGPALFTSSMTKLKAIMGHESIISMLCVPWAQHLQKNREIFCWLCREVLETVLNHRE